MFLREHVRPGVVFREILLLVGLVLGLRDVVELHVADVQFLLLHLRDEVRRDFAGVVLETLGLRLEHGGHVAYCELGGSFGSGHLGEAILYLRGVVRHMFVIMAGEYVGVVPKGEVVHVLFLVHRVVSDDVLGTLVVLELLLLLTPDVSPLISPQVEVALPQLLSFQLGQFMQLVLFD